MDRVEVNPRIARRHPEIRADDVLHAWRNAIMLVERSADEAPDSLLVAVDFDSRGRLLEMVAVSTGIDSVHVFHAMTPPSKKDHERDEMGQVREWASKRKMAWCYPMSSWSASLSGLNTENGPRGKLALFAEGLIFLGKRSNPLPIKIRQVRLPQWMPGRLVWV